MFAIRFEKGLNRGRSVLCLHVALM